MSTDSKNDVVSITGARESLTDDMRSRQRRYLVSMGVRTVAFVSAVAFLHGWARWTGVALAVVLPWFAVVGANITRGSARPAPRRVARPDQRALTAEPARPAPVIVGGAVRTADGRSARTTGTSSGGTTSTIRSAGTQTAPGPDGPVELTTTRRN